MLPERFFHWRSKKNYSYESHLIAPKESRVEIWSTTVAPDFTNLPYPDKGNPNIEARLAGFFNWVHGYLPSSFFQSD